MCCRHATPPHDVIDALADPFIHIVTMTITEKGYCRAPDGSLDPARADADSIYRYLAEGLALRHQRGLPGLTLLCCDNLAHNGTQLARLFLSYLAAHHPALIDWVVAQCTFPSSMVNRIVPATTDSDRTAFAAEAGLEDQALVLTEPFSQWVIEDRFAGPRPRWEVGGARFVADVAPFETAKLRMLNGSHSALAYLGLEAGHVFVQEAVADPALRPLIERLMREEAAPTIETAPGQDLDAYATSLMDRFGNAGWRRWRRTSKGGVSALSFFARLPPGCSISAATGDRLTTQWRCSSQVPGSRTVETRWSGRCSVPAG